MKTIDEDIRNLGFCSFSEALWQIRIKNNISIHDVDSINQIAERIISGWNYVYPDKKDENDKKSNQLELF